MEKLNRWWTKTWECEENPASLVTIVTLIALFGVSVVVFFILFVSVYPSLLLIPSIILLYFIGREYNRS